MRSLERLPALALALLVASASPARADDVDAARKKFAEGNRLYQKGDYEGARQLFTQADAEHHAPAIVYNLGLAEEKLGHVQAAIDAYESYLADAGDGGELSSPASIAIAQLKSRSTKLRVESKPPGARVFVDGAALKDLAPATLYVSAGHHLVSAQGEGWTDEKPIETSGAGEALVVTLASKVPDVSPPPSIAPPRDVAPPALPPPIDEGPNTEVLPERHPDGFVWGASFAIVPCYLLGVTTANATNERPGTSIVAGPTLDLGVALSERFEFLARGFVGIGPDAKPSYAYLGGPGLSFNVAHALWLGAAFIGGQLETRVHDERYGTDQVFGGMLEASVVVLRKPDGEWIASFEPSLLLTEQKVDNTTFFFPFAFGYRAY